MVIQERNEIKKDGTMRERTGGVCLIVLTDTEGTAVQSLYETTGQPKPKPVTGTNLVVQELARELVKRDVPVSVLVPVFDDDAANWELIVGRGRVQALGALSGKNRSVGQNFQRAMGLFRRFRPDQIHLHCPHWRWGVEVAIAAGLSGARTVWRTEHNPLMQSASGLGGLLFALADAKVHRFIYVSEGNQERFESYLPRRKQRGVVVPNGIDPRRFAPATDSSQDAAHKAFRAARGWPPDCRIAVYVGSFGGRRALDPLLEAFHRLRSDPAMTEDASRWRFLVIGYSSAENERNTRAMAREYGLCDSEGNGVIRFDGPSNDVSSALPHCDLYVASSHFEGMSIAYLEAMACGLPLLVSRVDGVTDVLGKELAAHAMPDYYDTDGFVARWGSYMRNYEQEKARFSGIAARVRSEFSMAKMLSRYLKLYNID